MSARNVTGGCYNMRFGIIIRENNTKFLFDKETLKEYPLTIDTLMGLLNCLNNEILDYEGILIKLGDGFKETIENQEGLLLGNVPDIQFNTIIDVLNCESNNHKSYNEKMFKEYGAFDKEGDLK